VGELEERIAALHRLRILESAASDMYNTMEVVNNAITRQHLKKLIDDSKTEEEKRAYYVIRSLNYLYSTLKARIDDLNNEK